MASSEKRCHYEILGVNRDSSPEEIRSAYRKLALQRHPDKLIKTGVSEEQATAAFQELVSAYEVLSDPKERAWYDSHRSQILFSDVKSSKSKSSVGSVPDLYSFFSNSVYSGFGDSRKGFYKVYGDVFDKIYGQEILFARKLGLGLDSVNVAPLMGNLNCDYAQVTAFYGYWLKFSTVMDFCWVDEYDVLNGADRKSRRVMEEENKKVRKKAKKEYNDTVRGLAAFVKKRDKRVIDMQLKRTLELEKKMEEEKARKKEAARAKLERARMYEEPDWAKIDEEEIEMFEEDEDDSKKNGAKELYCVVCSKKFKSDKQWKNHEQSKKHREKVAELGHTFGAEEEEGEEELGDDVDDFNTEFGPSTTVDNIMDELSEKFESDVVVQDDKSEVRDPSSDGEGAESSNAHNGDEAGKNGEINTLKEKASGRKSRKNVSSKRQPETYPSDTDVGAKNEEVDLMDYSSRRNARKNRAAKREDILKPKEEAVSNSNGDQVRDAEDGSSADFMSHMPEEVNFNSKRDTQLDKNQKVSDKQIKKNVAGKTNASIKLKKTEEGGAITKMRNASKGSKQKATSKNSSHSCETCGEDFGSRNKLHKHLGDTGHAALKSR
ncbi:Dnaj-like protein [Thalictrum thalictroides]|uniref:Dnaj-like protein n=1 Tax=Thalictrum thalictroides TaxID=46969 RepID=A0A7J6VQ13_THATH|nr:Dnaj-like protein [Thalictrum thalictroides]